MNYPHTTTESKGTTEFVRENFLPYCLATATAVAKMVIVKIGPIMRGITCMGQHLVIFKEAIFSSRFTESLTLKQSPSQVYYMVMETSRCRQDHIQDITNLAQPPSRTLLISIIGSYIIE